MEDWGFDNDTHQIYPQDLERVLDGGIKFLIIGTGYSGQAFLTDKAKVVAEQLKAKGIQVHVLPSGEAVKLFNKTSPKKGVLAIFHLNC